jgi:hypothetical protein
MGKMGVGAPSRPIREVDAKSCGGFEMALIRTTEYTKE